MSFDNDELNEGLQGAELTNRSEAPAVPNAASYDLGEWVYGGKIKESGEAEIFRVRKGPLHGVAKVYKVKDGKAFQPDEELLRQIADIGGGRVINIHEFRWMAQPFGGVSQYLEVMEYCKGGDLSQFLGKPMEDGMARKVLAQLSEGLHQLHEKEIVHRDIKPGNIFLRSADPVDLCLADFGIASFGGGKPLLGNKHFTLKYASPTQLGAGSVEFADDWWSVGMVMLELLSGRHCFEGMSRDEIIVQIPRLKVVLPARLEKTWQVMLEGLLALRPDDRWGYEQVKRWLDRPATTPSRSEATCKSIGPWMVLDDHPQLREGEAELFHVRNRETSQLAVLKVYLPEASDAGSTLRPDPEILDILKKSSIKGVVRLFDHGVGGKDSGFDARFYEIQEECGENVARVLGGNRDQKQIFQLLAEISDALRGIHSLSLVHRDIRTANLLIRNSGTLEYVLSDFGIAAFGNQQPRKARKHAGHLYASPSQLTSGYVSSADDWWGLGMVVYELLRGENPFQGQDPDYVKLQYTERKFKPMVPPGMSPRWQELLDGLLDYTSERRWSYKQVREWCNGGLEPKVPERAVITGGEADSSKSKKSRTQNKGSDRSSKDAGTGRGGSEPNAPAPEPALQIPQPSSDRPVGSIPLGLTAGVPGNSDLKKMDDGTMDSRENGLKTWVGAFSSIFLLVAAIFGLKGFQLSKVENDASTAASPASKLVSPKEIQRLDNQWRKKAAEGDAERIRLEDSRASHRGRKYVGPNLWLTTNDGVVSLMRDTYDASQGSIVSKRTLTVTSEQEVDRLDKEVAELEAALASHGQSNYGDINIWGTTNDGVVSWAIVSSLGGTVAERKASPVQEVSPPVATKPKPVPHGKASITAEPAGATVMLDGTNMGMAPISAELPAGQAVFTLVLKPFPDQRVTLAIPDGDLVSTNIVFPSGRIKFVSDPIGARVVLDDRDVGATPFLTDPLPVGKRLEAKMTLTDSKMHFDDITVRGSVKENETLEVVGHFPRGNVHIESNPEGASVVLQGKKWGNTPLDMADMPAGIHILMLSLSGHQPAESKVLVTDGGDEKTLINLVPIEVTPPPQEKVAAKPADQPVAVPAGGSDKSAEIFGNLLGAIGSGIQSSQGKSQKDTSAKAAADIFGAFGKAIAESAQNGKQASPSKGAEAAAARELTRQRSTLVAFCKTIADSREVTALSKYPSVGGGSAKVSDYEKLSSLASKAADFCTRKQVTAPDDSCRTYARLMADRYAKFKIWCDEAAKSQSSGGDNSGDMGRADAEYKQAEAALDQFLKGNE